MKLVTCNSLQEVRENIDRIDRSLVGTIAERRHYVRQAARFKTTTAGVQAPDRVEQGVMRVRELADELDANPDLVERIYRVMIAGFIDEELSEHRRIR